MRKLPTWENKLNKKLERKESFEYFAMGFGSLLMQILLILQFGAGGLRGLAFADKAVNILLITIVLSILILIVYPKWYFDGIKKVGHFLGKYLVNQIANLVLLLIFLVALPFAKFFGQKKYLAARPEHKSWVRKESEWSVSTWVAKPEITKVIRKQNPIFRLLGIFIAQRNWFLLTITSLLIIISMIILFVQSSAVAPFIYTFF